MKRPRRPHGLRIWPKRPHRPQADRLERAFAGNARHHIVDVANQHRDPMSKPYTMRRLNEAVCVVRNNRLVDDKVLKSAGFNPGRHRIEHASVGVSTGRRKKA